MMLHGLHGTPLEVAEESACWVAEGYRSMLPAEYYIQLRHGCSTGNAVPVDSLLSELPRPQPI